MRAYSWLGLVVVAQGLSCSKPNVPEKAPDPTPAERARAARGEPAARPTFDAPKGRTPEESTALRSLARRKSGKGKRISMAQDWGLHGSARRVVESLEGVETNASTYDCKGYPLEMGTAKFTWTFDDAGCPVRAETALGLIVAECDASGRPVLTKTLDPASEEPIRTEHRDYDAEGRQVWLRTFGTAGEVLQAVDSEYNDRGDLSVETVESAKKSKLHAQSRLQRFAYEYADDGSKIVTVTEEPAGTVKRLTYGAHGFVEREETLDAAGTVTTAVNNEYTLDEHGNWTQRKEQEAGQDKVRVYTRTIEYCE